MNAQQRQRQARAPLVTFLFVVDVVAVLYALHAALGIVS